MRKAGFTLEEVREFARSPRMHLRKGKRDTLEKEDGRVNVFLGGNRIASFNPRKGRLSVSSAGWNTVTTKARLNKILPSNYGVTQRNFQWFLSTPKGTLVPFKYKKIHLLCRSIPVPFSIKVGQSETFQKAPEQRAMGQIQRMVMKRRGLL